MMTASTPTSAPARRPFRGATALLALPAIVAASATVSDAAATAPAFEDGARSVFIGHSFFVPVAAAFDQLAAQNDFPLHDADMVFRGGPAGSPGALWEDPAARAEVEGHLAGGDVEVLGLTYFSEANSGFDDYARWIDLALAYNPDTRFFVGAPWAPGGPSMETAAYDAANETLATTAFEVVDQLRDAYGDDRIAFIGYGKTASVMKARFDAGTLPDIVELVGVGPEYLFADGLIGHGGPMMLELCALSWATTLYGAPLETLAFTEYESDVAGIVAEVLAYNEAFRSGPVPGDVDGDGIVGLVDLLAVLADWGPCADCPSDLDGDGLVTFDDMLIVVTNWS